MDVEANYTHTHGGRPRPPQSHADRLRAAVKLLADGSWIAVTSGNGGSERPVFHLQTTSAGRAK
jgi:hypothetical protein